ncbi:2'-5' RNA ligase family protein [Streptomyces sp. NPDC004658]|uniref:2'-5' RNA ligase family protein n=1 Tax=Streptomyces sp. NPDC004658 TaxID=3154672 RepID=UPI0033BB3338
MALSAPHPDAFPSVPPIDIDNPATVAAHDWAAFNAVSAMKNHWHRPGWSETTRAVYWLLTISDSAFIAHARRCQSFVRHLQFDEIAPDGFHLTLGRVGVVDMLNDEGQMEGLVATVQAKAPPAFVLTAVPLTGSRGALRYSVAPWTPILELHQVLVTASEACGLPSMAPTARLRPHIGIGYANRPLPAAVARNAVLPLRSLPPATLTIDRADLVEMWREPGAYKWRIIHSVQLQTIVAGI